MAPKGTKFCASFTPPPEHKQLAAIGLSNDAKRLLETDCYPKTAADPQALRACFDPKEGHWEDLDPPGLSEWLHAMRDKTPDQSFKDYVQSRPNRPERSRRTIYLQPLCEPGELEGPAFPEGPWPSWQALEAAVSRFYAPLCVRTLPPMPMAKLSPLPDSRNNCYGRQWHAGQVLDALRGKQLPNDAYCMLAVTMWDLYPREEWNFVYGLANLTARVGVFSFVRHTPDFGSKAEQGAHMLHRSMKTMCHEIGHMFGMRHCTWYNCLMRGSNGEGVEHQRNHLHLCPVCLRKLHWNVGFDIPARYEKLLELYDQVGAGSEAFKQDLEFLQQRLGALEHLPPGVTLMKELGSWGASGRVRAATSTSRGTAMRAGQAAPQASAPGVRRSSSAASPAGERPGSGEGRQPQRAAMADVRHAQEPRSRERLGSPPGDHGEDSKAGARERGASSSALSKAGKASLGLRRELLAPGTAGSPVLLSYQVK